MTCSKSQLDLPRLMVFTIEQFPGFRHEIEISEEMATYIEENPEKEKAYFLKAFDEALSEWIKKSKRIYS